MQVVTQPPSPGNMSTLILDGVGEESKAIEEVKDFSYEGTSVYDNTEYAYYSL